jgi:hypothetical protein
MADLVLKRFELNESAEEFLVMEGRKGGLFAWLAALIGLDPTTYLICNREEIKYESSALTTGKQSLRVPLAAITAVSSGIAKPFNLLVKAVIRFIIGLVILILGIANGDPGIFVVFFLLFLVWAAVAVVFYILRKTMSFGIYNGGDKPIAFFTCKPSIIEGQGVNDERYEAAANAIVKAALALHR